MSNPCVLESSVHGEIILRDCLVKKPRVLFLRDESSQEKSGWGTESGPEIQAGSTHKPNLSFSTNVGDNVKRDKQYYFLSVRF